MELVRDGNVAVLALDTWLFMTSMPLDGKVGAVALLHGEAERLVRAARHTARDASRHRRQLTPTCAISKPSAVLRASLQSARDLVKIAARRCPPSAQTQLPPTAWMNGAADILADVLVVDAAGGDELDAAEGTGERLHRASGRRRRSPGRTSRPSGRGDIAAMISVGVTQPGVTAIPFSTHQLTTSSLEARGDDELCAAGDGLLALFERDDRARAHEHVGALLRRLP